MPRTPAHGSSSKALLAGIAAAALGFAIVPGWFVRRRRGIRVARSPGALGLRKRRNLPEREAILIPKTTAPPEAEETPKLRRVTEPAVAQLRDAVVARSEPPRRREWPKLHAAETAASQPAPAIALAPEPEPVEVEPEPVDETMPVLPQPLPTQLVETPWVAEPPAYLPDEPAAEELVEIAFWRGYRKSAFYARTFDEDGFEVALAESAAFRASGNGVPDQTEEAVRAYEEFVDALVADGWTPVESARPAAWFAQTFERR
jgi:hypothetical protein